mmetsp:Transcript_23590/g.58607  ORF Transcript_23590/g.58607 Transcript_23590/m.58607 type:complete len:227 (+) Transcript_23590:275-955(+)
MTMLRLISETLTQPHSAMASSNSFRRISITVDTPSSPLVARPHTYGRPIMTAVAPSASAFTISVPRRTPESMKTGICPFTAVATSSSASMVLTTPSSCLAPWLLTIIPAQPVATAALASSPVTTPFARIGSFVMDLSHATSFHDSEQSMRLATYAARPEEFPDCPMLAFWSAKLPMVRCDGSEKPFLTSLMRRPRRGVSTVSAIARYPIFSARRTSFSVMTRSLYT